MRQFPVCDFDASVDSHQMITPINMISTSWIRKIFGRAAQQGRTANQRDWLREAKTIEGLKQWPELINHCVEWSRAEPNDSFAWNSLGNAYQFAKQFDEAVKAYLYALKLRPLIASSIYAALANAYHGLNDFDKALESLRNMEGTMRHNRDDPLSDDVYAWSGLALSYHALNDMQSMMGAFQQAELLAHNRSHDDADEWLVIGLAYKKIGSKDNARRVYQQLQTVDPEKAKQLLEHPG